MYGWRSRSEFDYEWFVRMMPSDKQFDAMFPSRRERRDKIAHRDDQTESGLLRAYWIWAGPQQRDLEEIG